MRPMGWMKHPTSKNVMDAEMSVCRTIAPVDMRHVKLSPEREVDAAALKKLIETAYADMKRRLGKPSRRDGLQL